MNTECDTNQAAAVFLVTGSDTGVGKTVFTGLLGRYLSDKGVCLRLAKPFCSGGRGDVEFLAACGALGQAEVNYWYDDEPTSPAAWELRTSKRIDFEGCVEWVQKTEEVRSKEVGLGEVLLVEGVGGLLAPLANGRTVASLGQALGSQLILVAPNRVGVVDHVLLTAEAALARGLSVACVVLMEQEETDLSAVDNAELIRMHLPEMADFKGVFEFPWLGEGADDPGLIALNLKKADGVLGEIFEACVLPSLGRDASVD